MKTTYLMLTTALLATLWSSAIASTVCPDCSQHAEGATLRDPVSCSHYYKCVKGRAQRKNCGQGFYFDERFLICNFAAFVDCNKALKPTTTTTAAPPSCIKITTTCEPPTQPPCKPKTTTCAPPAKEPADDPEPEHCEKKPTTPCPDKSNRVIVDTLQHSSDCKSLKDGTILLDGHHCRRYYVCRLGKAKHRWCSVGQWYDGHKKACRNQDDVTNCAANRN